MVLSFQLGLNDDRLSEKDKFFIKNKSIKLISSVHMTVINFYT